MISASVKDSEPLLKLLIQKDADVNMKSEFQYPVYPEKV